MDNELTSNQLALKRLKRWLNNKAFTMTKDDLHESSLNNDSYWNDHCYDTEEMFRILEDHDFAYEIYAHNHFDEEHNSVHINTKMKKCKELIAFLSPYQDELNFQLLMKLVVIWRVGLDSKVMTIEEFDEYDGEFCNFYLLAIKVEENK